jgi:hypothetical protein
MVSFNDQIAEERIRTALHRLASMSNLDGKFVVNVPIMYPSGSMVTVDVDRNGSHYWVSDMGIGLIEAEFMAAQSIYRSVAGNVADQYAVSFDGHSMFALKVTNERLEAAIAAIANASNTACSEAIRIASEIKTKKQNEKIFERIQSIFGEKIVAKSAEIQGRHAHWEAHNVVVFPDKKRAVFEHMTTHTSSVSSKFLMFSDIRASHRDISLNAIVPRIDALDEKAQIIGDVANIVSLKASDEEFRKFALAA